MYNKNSSTSTIAYKNMINLNNSNNNRNTREGDGDNKKILDLRAGNDGGNSIANRNKRRRLLTYHLATPEEPERNMINTNSVTAQSKNNVLNDFQSDNAFLHNIMDDKTTTLHAPSLKETRELEVNILKTVRDLKRYKELNSDGDDTDQKEPLDVDNIISLLSRSLTAVSHWTLQSQLSLLSKGSEFKNTVATTNNFDNCLRSPPIISSKQSPKLMEPFNSKNVEIQGSIILNDSPINEADTKIQKSSKPIKKRPSLSANDNLLTNKSPKTIKFNYNNYYNLKTVNQKIENKIKVKKNISPFQTPCNIILMNSPPGELEDSDKVSKNTHNNGQSEYLHLIESNKPHPRMRRTSDNPAKNEYIRVFHLKKVKS
ncbi:hypothetical protein TPHA_0A03230 [Tetrapisispora phaffii CBS 4417]|uniref:Uncharacterized protein n=1 Tax=Tetrapisispora phaffii (strain ATCC 24235 / CBS 4417 / NBRC 1672 / NRRL Y-8282 / UCD 70-5) TaxID=1071381 RepID=G8BNC2_TETPH|nr:hypothetical protein TPHA_0A03230 [Tetrapisispora phaffii CBS 4417]CCE61400.1 hypothetical protein TPHA_0A03230 [Tetrapisispora phaffii CBS 4417]